MSTVTDNLKMFVYEPDIDGIQTFNIDRCIGDNFKKIDKMLNVYSYDSTFTYSAGMHVLDNGIIYKSLTDDNIGKALTNTTYWSKELYRGDNTAVLQTLQAIYPVGSIYIGMTSTCPLSSLFGTWSKITGGLTLQQADSNHTVGTVISAGLPNIEGSFTVGSGNYIRITNPTGVFSTTDKKSNTDKGGSDPGSYDRKAVFDASTSNSIYGNSNTVQPPALAVNIWRRVA